MRKRRFVAEEEVTTRGFTRWVSPRMDKYLLQCCDCGLVHEMQFRLVLSPVVKSAKSHQKIAVQFRARRAPGYTRQQRKRRGIDLKHG